MFLRPNGAIPWYQTLLYLSNNKTSQMTCMTAATKTFLNYLDLLFISITVLLSVCPSHIHSLNLLFEFEQQLAFKVSRVHPCLICSEQRFRTSVEMLTGGWGTQVEFERKFCDVWKWVQQIHLVRETGKVHQCGNLTLHYQHNKN